jgi:hypothetical protein
VENAESVTCAGSCSPAASVMITAFLGAMSLVLLSTDSGQSQRSPPVVQCHLWGTSESMDWLGAADLLRYSCWYRKEPPWTSNFSQQPLQSWLR